MPTSELDTALDLLKEKFGATELPTAEVLKSYVTETQRLHDLKEAITDKDKKNLDNMTKTLDGWKRMTDYSSKVLGTRDKLSRQAKRELTDLSKATTQTVKKVDSLTKEFRLRAQLAGVEKENLVVSRKELAFYKERVKQVKDAAKQQTILLKNEIKHGKLTSDEAKKKIALVKIYDVLLKKTKEYTKLMETGAAPKQLARAGADVFDVTKMAMKAEKAGGPTMSMVLNKQVKESLKRLPSALGSTIKDTMKGVVQHFSKAIMGVGGVALLVSSILKKVEEDQFGQQFGALFWEQFGADAGDLDKALKTIGPQFSKALGGKKGLRESFWKVASELRGDAAEIFKAGMLGPDAVKKTIDSFKQIESASVVFFEGSIQGAAESAISFKLLDKNLDKTLWSLRKVAKEAQVPFSALRQTFSGLMGDTILYGTSLKGLMGLQGELFKQLSGRSASLGITSFKQMGDVVKNLSTLSEQGSLSAQMYLARMQTGKGGLDALRAWRYGAEAKLKGTEATGFEITGRDEGDAAGMRYDALRKQGLKLVSQLGMVMGKKALGETFGFGLDETTFQALVGPKGKRTGDMDKLIEEGFKNASKTQTQTLAEQLSATKDVNKKLEVIKEQLQSVIGKTLILILTAIVGGIAALSTGRGKEYTKIMGGLGRDVVGSSGTLLRMLGGGKGVGKDVTKTLFPFASLFGDMTLEEALRTKAKGKPSILSSFLPGGAGRQARYEGATQLIEEEAHKRLQSNAKGGTITPDSGIYMPSLPGADNMLVSAQMGEDITPKGGKGSLSIGVNVNTPDIYQIGEKVKQEVIKELSLKILER